MMELDLDERRRWLSALLRISLVIAAVWTDVAPSSVRAADAPAVEVICERSPEGRVKIEREVTTDSDGNYVNHGTWREWDATGNLVAEGRYQMGLRDGQWTRWLNREESPVLGERPFDEFQPPFMSRAEFAGGKMDGDWTVVDAKNRKCSRVTLREGKRNGKAILWLPGGKVYREATFRSGVAVDDVRERGADGRLATVATYVDGHQVVNKVTHHPGTFNKRTDANYLTAAVIESSTDDFWNCRFAEYTTRGEDQRHGTWKSWYPNGQVELDGGYQFDRENGTFTWWHANGQKAVEGAFVDGQADGTWTWWHANGQKASHGEYHYGTLVGLWRGWTDEGRLVQRNEYVDGSLVDPRQQTAQQVDPERPSAGMAR